MTELDSWRPDDDDRIRAALMSLYADVEAEPLPSPAEIRARAEGGRSAAGGATVVDLADRRRRRARFAVAGAAAAAAVAVVAAGFASLGRTGASNTDPAATTNRSALLAEMTAAGLRLPVAADWGSLGWASPTVVDARPGAVDCYAPAAGLAWTGTGVHLGEAEVGGAQVGRAQDEKTAVRARELVDDSLASCDAVGPVVETATGDDWSARRTRRADGVRDWRVIVQRGPDVLYLWLAEPEDRPVDAATLRFFVDRLLGTSGTPTTGISAPTNPTGTTGGPTAAPSPTAVAPNPVSTTAPAPSSTAAAPPAGSGAAAPTGQASSIPPTSPTSTSSTTSKSSAPTSTSESSTSPSEKTTLPSPVEEKMYVTGDIPGSAFIPGSQWASAAMDVEATVSADGYELDPQLNIFDCDDADPNAVARGAVVIQMVGSKSIGMQRIEQYPSAAAADARYQQLTGSLSATCNGGTTTATPGPVPGTFRLVVTPEGMPDVVLATSWVGVTTTPSHGVSVVQLDGEQVRIDNATGLAEVARLNALAAQR